MEELLFDSGLSEYRLGAGVLRFNPRDPNLYHRFLQAGEKLKALEKELEAKATEAENGPEALALLAETDRRAKAVLDEVFPGSEPFETLLFGVSLFAGAENGCRVLENLMAALTPILEEGARAFYEAEADAEVKKADAARLARKAP